MHSEKKSLLYILLQKIFQSSLIWPVCAILLSVGSAVFTSAQVAVLADFTDAAVGFVSDGKYDGYTLFTKMAAPTAIFLFVLAAEQFLPRLNTVVNLHLENALRLEFRTSLTDKVSRLAYRHIEDKDDWDLIWRVFHHQNLFPETIMANAYMNLLTLFSTFAGMTGIMLILIKQVWWAAVIILILFIPVFYVAKLGGKEMYQVKRDLAETQRYMEYDSQTLMGRESARERAIFGYTDTLNDRFCRAFKIVQEAEHKKNKLAFLRQSNTSCMFYFVITVMMAMLLLALVKGKITLGLFLAMVTAFSEMVWNVVYSLLEQVQQLTIDLEYMADVRALEEKDEVSGAQEMPGKITSFEKIEIRNLRFAYPGSNYYILDGLNMEFHKGKHYAIVGVNGAGKTTLTKLLLGLYPDYEGEILIDAKELRQLSAGEQKALFSAVYQDFVRYQLTVEENIAFGNPERSKKAAEAIVSAGLSEMVESLPKGMQTPLGRLEESAADLSGGQWQRVAIARALVNDAPVRILDEPTAALDPVSESQLYQEFGRISHGKTTVLISHRLGSARTADEIYLLDKGCVSEHGSHDELMKLDGMYAEMYNAQRSWYL